MKKILITLMLALGAPLSVFAVSPSDIGTQACNVSPGALGCGSSSVFGAGGIFNNGINDVIYVTGAISVLMIVIGGLRYVLSGGDAAGTRGAKDTILYAVVGLVISMVAFSIVNFVIGRL